MRHLKGFAEPWRLFALDPATVLDSKPEPVMSEPPGQVRDGLRVRFPRLLSISPTLVGRAEELQLLQATRRRAAGGEPTVVLVG